MRLFEIGRRYLGDREHPTLGLLLAGERRARAWQSGKAQPFDRVRCQGRGACAARCGGRSGREPPGLSRCRTDWHPGRSARLGLGPKTIVAAFGELHPSLTRSLEAPAGAIAAEIYFDAIPAPRSSGHARSPYTPPALQAVTRDFAFIVPAELAAGDLLRAIRGADKTLITDARLFDRFETAEGLSLAFEVMLQPVEKSFTDEQIAEVSKRIVAAAEKLGARLRS